MATENRDVGATQSARVCNERERDQVAAQMSHSRRTQQAYYVRLKSSAESREGYKILAKLRQGGGAAHTKRPFSDEEIETIKLYFESYIDALDKFGLPQAREFLENHPMNRDPQQIRDKVRHLIDLKKRELEKKKDE